MPLVTIRCRGPSTDGDCRALYCGADGWLLRGPQCSCSVRSSLEREEFVAETRLRWNGSIAAQQLADAAYSRLKPKAKKQPKTKNARKHSKHAKVVYHEYILSSKWKRKREQKLREVGYTCENKHCGSNQGLQVHHKTYKRLGHERMSDLRVLCRFCHEDEHADKVLPTDPASLKFAEMVKSF